MKPTTFLIDSTLEALVDEPALIATLQSGQIGDATLDVFEVEPLPRDSPLPKTDNVMLAPHNANSSPAAWERVYWNTTRNLLEGSGVPFQLSSRR